MRFVNGQRAVVQRSEVVVARRQAGCARDNAGRADTGAGTSGATACGRAAHTRSAESFAVDKARDGLCEGWIGCAIQTVLAVRAHRQRRFVNGQRAVHIADVVALLNGIKARCAKGVTACIDRRLRCATIAKRPRKGRIEGGNGIAHPVATGISHAVISFAVTVGGHGQRSEEGGEQWRSLTFVDTPGGAAAAGVGDAEAGKVCLHLHVRSGESSGTTAYPVSGVSSTRAVDIPIAVADRAEYVSAHQSAYEARSTHAACGVAVADRAEGAPHQTADGGRAAHTARSVAVADPAAVVPHQPADVGRAGHAATHQPHVSNYGSRAGGSKQTNVICCRPIDGEVVDGAA